MTEEEIRNRIKVCEDRIYDYLEVGKNKVADRYKKEIFKWEKLLLQLNPKLEEELRDYKRVYRTLEKENKQLKEQLEKEKEIRKKAIEINKKVIEEYKNNYGKAYSKLFFALKTQLEILESSDK